MNNNHDMGMEMGLWRKPKLTVFIGCLVLSVLLTVPALQAQQNQDKITIGIYRTLHSTVLKETRRVWISLPVDYDRVKRRYPVIYKCDAISSFLFADRVSDLNRAPLKYQLPRHILVSIENTDRNRDMYPAADKKVPFKPGAENFLKFIETELIPFVEKSYRCDGFRILVGESNSALFSVYAFLAKPHLFNGYIANSPSLYHCFSFIDNLAAKSFSKLDYSRKHLFMIYGEKDIKGIITQVPEFEERIKKASPKGLRWKSVKLESEGHVPDSGFEKGLAFIYRGYRMPDKLIANGIDGFKQYYLDYSKRMGHHFDVPNYPYFKYGRSLLAQKKMSDALELVLGRIDRGKEDAATLQMALFAASIAKRAGRLEDAIRMFKYASILSPPMAGFMQKRIERLRLRHNK